MKKTLFFIMGLFWLTALVFWHGSRDALAENIDPDEDGSQYAYGENVGWFNFEPSEGPGVTVTDAELTGYAWGENTGWINLRPSIYGGVTNDGNGNLSGYAWGENTGWINFNPSYAGVTIDTNGNFDGWAWGENIGWIHFQNQSIPYKVQTAWVPTISTTSSTSISTTTSIKCEVTISPKSAYIYTWETVQFSATSSGPCNSPCYTWSVIGEAGGTIDNNGLYRARGNTGDDRVRATDICNGSISDNASVRVSEKTSSTTTTTICEILEIFGEGSEEVKLMRSFRDNVLSQTPVGQEIIRLYYEWSPAIVKTMEENEAFREEVKEMIDGVLGLVWEEAE